MKNSIIICLIFLTTVSHTETMQSNSPKKIPSNDRLPSNNHAQHIKISPRKISTEKKRPDLPLPGQLNGQQRAALARDLYNAKK